jgi:transcription elongation factor Elf1
MVQVHSSPVLRRAWAAHNRGYTCPGCGSWRVVPAVAGDARRHFCVACENCWEVHGDLAVRVDPLHCAGCGRDERCYGRLQETFPAFTYGETQ